MLYALRLFGPLRPYGRIEPMGASPRANGTRANVLGLGEGYTPPRTLKPWVESYAPAVRERGQPPRLRPED